MNINGVDVKSCPTCGKENITVSVDSLDYNYYMLCGDCGDRTTTNFSIMQAVAEWNSKFRQLQGDLLLG